jgi:hypothetical protein
MRCVHQLLGGLGGKFQPDDAEHRCHEADPDAERHDRETEVFEELQMTSS